MNLLSPKSDFLKDEKRAGAWQDVVANPLFNEAVKHALLSYQMELTKSDSEGPNLAVVGLRMQGARQFLEHLMNLGLLTKLPSNTETDTLEPV